MKKTIDLNCDMGESFGVYQLGLDDEVIKLISSVNVACGFHGGDPNIMDHTVAMAKKYGVGVGAHPGFQDLAGFGRRNIDMERKDLMNLIIYQIGAINIFCQKHEVPLTHVKPHGNMNNMADSDVEMATNIVDAVLAVRPDLPIMVKPNSQLHLVAKAKGLPFILELFADRSYNSDFSLVSRRFEGAVITNPNEVAKRMVRMVTEGKITTYNGEEIEIEGQSICVHGDTSTALQMIKTIRNELERVGIHIAPFSV